MRKTLLLLAVVLLAACPKKHETVTTTTTAPAAAPATTSSAPAAGTVAHSGDDLLALANGALVISEGKPSESNGKAWHMLDEDPATGWCSDTGTWNQPIVIEMPVRATIKSVAFDTAKDEWEGRIPKEVLLEISDASARDGFKQVADVTLSGKQADNETFAIATPAPGRWLRVTLKAMNTGNIAQIMELRAFGDRLEQAAIPNVTGTYKFDLGEMHLKQEGATVIGCFDHGVAPIVGGMDGRLLKFEWNAENDDRGPAIMIFGSDRVFGGHWKMTGVAAENPHLDAFDATKSSSEPGTCPQWKPPQDAMAAQLKQSGRVRLYGINFDSDSDVIRPESKPTLDQVAAMLKSSPELKITIEGHTDNTSTPEHNQQLSEKRANAVKQYLVNAGIDGGRLNAAGFGATKPVASNDSALGRAENRRVELSKG
jgi:outer membrane protein OmpA-like peptidoglycan-associated protein